MKKITIHHLGPVEQIDDLSLEANMLLIGPQASGKSTIAKAVYFFKHIRIDIIQYFLEKIESGSFEKAPLSEIGKIIRAKFLNFWGSSFGHHPEMYTNYCYSAEIFISIRVTQVDKFVSPEFSKALQDAINSIYQEVKIVTERIRKEQEQAGINKSAEQRLLLDSKMDALKLETINRLNEVFDENEELLFIPAGRSAFAVLTDEIIALSSQKVDSLTRAFAEQIKETRPLFNRSLPRIIAEEKQRSLRPLSVGKAQKAIPIIDSILNGEYQYTDGEERIYLNDRRYVKLNYASSGQQESLWILLSIFKRILNGEKVFVVFEEPEAHLFPKAQRDIVRLIALLANTNKGNRVMITTHSPYILTAFNNLLYAEQVGKKHHQEVDRLIGKDYWLESAKNTAYFVENGSIRSIIKDELIDATEIDGASDEINALSDKLIDLELR